MVPAVDVPRKDAKNVSIAVNCLALQLVRIVSHVASSRLCVNNVPRSCPQTGFLRMKRTRRADNALLADADWQDDLGQDDVNRSCPRSA